MAQSFEQILSRFLELTIFQVFRLTFDFFQCNLLLGRSHQAEIIIVINQIKKAFYSRTQQRDQGAR